MRYYQALYLCACHGHEWPPSLKGYRAFVAQIKGGLRNTDGRMFWEERRSP